MAVAVRRGADRLVASVAANPLGSGLTRRVGEKRFPAPCASGPRAGSAQRPRAMDGPEAGPRFRRTTRIAAHPDLRQATPKGATQVCSAGPRTAGHDDSQRSQPATFDGDGWRARFKAPKSGRRAVLAILGTGGAGRRIIRASGCRAEDAGGLGLWGLAPLGHGAGQACGRRRPCPAGATRQPPACCAACARPPASRGPPR